MWKRPIAAALALGALACGEGQGPAAGEVRPLRIAVAPELDNLDPRTQMHGGQAVLCNVFEGLVAFDAQMRIVPALAERWESPDELTWRFHLRPGVRFHDGRALRAADVVTSLDRARRPNPAMASNLAAVTDVTSPAPGVVEVRTARPDPMLLNNLVPSFVLPTGDVGGKGPAIGTGPYGVVSFDPASRLELAAFPGYWGAQAHERRLEFVFERDPERRLAMLVDGSVDVALRLPEASQVAETGHVRLFTRAAPGARLIGLRVDRPPFSDLRLRRAVDAALDREAITREVLASRARPLGQLLPQGFFGYAPDLEPHARDLATARRLLKEAHAVGLPVTLAHGAGRIKEAERIAAELNEAGFVVTLEARPVAEIPADIERGGYAMILWSLISYTGDANDVFGNTLHSPDAERGWGSQNPFGYRSPRLDRLIEQAAAATSMSARLELFQQAMRVAVADLAVIPLWEVPWVTGVRDDVAFTPGADGWFWGAAVTRRPGR